MSASDRGHIWRSLAAQRAAKHRTERRQRRAQQVAERLRAGELLGAGHTCAVCGRHLGDPGSITRGELSGSTITITSLGPIGGIVTTPIINAPEVAIVGVNRIVERPVVRGGAIVPRQLMNLSSSFDHRVVDGHGAALFVQALKRLLETPALLFV